MPNRVLKEGFLDCQFFDILAKGLVFFVDKSFLRKNKKKTIKIDVLNKFDYQDIACEIFNQLKVIYIIDLSEKKDKNSMQYRVISMNLCHVKE